ncbi:hypothetical protein DEH18_01625 [Streptomyces sp. NHF165]|uniref:Uncharacterized protein n=1 Tax=Streptomyces cacaoi TaxID=1898 RepID=A0A4Y3R538_STRCI|nr:hypothetical protein DEH18_01625 [Streptomyces sp. NHF165]GEB52682.1 hypothetical protein SCA03_52330 [Streptomyces cacaoi]
MGQYEDVSPGATRSDPLSRARTGAAGPDGHGPDGHGPDGHRPDGYGSDEHGLCGPVPPGPGRCRAGA